MASKRRLLTYAVLFMGSILLPSTSFAQAAKSYPYTVPNVAIDELPILLTPLTKEQLEGAAGIWQGIVQAKAQELAEAELRSKRQRNAIEAAAEVSAAAVEEAEAKAEAEAEAQAAADAEAAAQAEAEAQEQAAAQAESENETEAEPEAGEVEEVEPIMPSEAEVLESEAIAQTEAMREERQEILDSATELREQRIALIDRARIVLRELEWKGGDPAPYKKYLTAVSSIRVDVTDKDATEAMIKGWIVSEEGGLRWARNAGLFLLILIAFFVASRVVGRIVDSMLGRAPKMTRLMREFAAKSVRRIVICIGFIVALSAMEVDIAPLLALIGAAGFVVAFALQDTLGNLASGIMILVYRPFDEGDVVEVGGVSGTVKSLNLVSVTINSFDNQVLIVPNNAV